MVDVMLTVVDATRAIHGLIPWSAVDAVAAGLATDPETVEELDAAISRFIVPGDGPGFFASFLPAAYEGPVSVGVMVVDLAARLLAVPSRQRLPRQQGEVQLQGYETGGEEIWLPYQVPEHWLFRHAVRGWRVLSDQRRAERAATPPLDTRRVLYGEVARFIARECLAACARSEEDPISEIHARWLMTHREDLRGQCPREILLGRRDFIDLDLQWRGIQWSFTGACPPGLSPESAAYRNAGFGIHENVLYYEMIRYLLGECWGRLSRDEDVSEEDEAGRLVCLQQEWLYTPQEADLYGLTPFFVIASERSRLPMALSPAQAVIDDDCPLCQMLAEGDTHTFWHLDGCNMEDDYPFSFYHTRNEWEAERRSWEAFSREFEEKQARRKAQGDPEACAGVWQTSFSDWESLDSLPRGEALSIAVFSIGGHLAELGLGLKDGPQGAVRVESLNQHFAELRDAAQGDTRWLARIVIRQFREELEKTGCEVPHLAAQCAHLGGQLARLGEWIGE